MKNDQVRPSEGALSEQDRAKPCEQEGRVTDYDLGWCKTHDSPMPLGSRQCARRVTWNVEYLMNPKPQAPGASRE